MVKVRKPVAAKVKTIVGWLKVVPTLKTAPLLLCDHVTLTNTKCLERGEMLVWERVLEVDWMSGGTKGLVTFIKTETIHNMCNMLKTRPTSLNHVLHVFTHINTLTTECSYFE